MRKILLTSILIGSMILGSIGVGAVEPVNPTNGWYWNEGQQATMYYMNGQKYSNGWYVIDGYTYHFGDCGFMSRGHAFFDGKQYTFTRDGKYIGEGFIEIPPLTPGENGYK